MKTIWMTLLSKSEDKAQKFMGQVKGYGLDVQGHFWTDDLEKMGWMGARDGLLDKDVALWLIIATKEDMESESKLYGLSLLTITLQAQRGHGFPIVILYDGADLPTAEKLPTPLKEAQMLPESSATLAPKLVALANKPVKASSLDYGLDIYGIPNLGQWFEVGPGNGDWKGVIFGVTQGEILAHGVGERGQLPTDKMILNYPQKGLKLKLGEKEYTAWAVQNEMSEKSSYFLKVEGHPDSILFGPYSSDDEAEVFIVKLK